MPRPKKHEAGLKNVVLFRLADEEFAALKEKVQNAGMTQAEFIRHCVLKNKTTIIAKIKTSLEKERMQYVFNKAGNNLNQIAHRLNAANRTHQLSYDVFKSGLRDLNSISNYLKAALDHVD